MAAISLTGLFQAGIDILKTTINTATSRILASTGSNGPTQTGETDNVEWWQHVGFASRPAAPDAGTGAAQGFIVRAGDYDICLASQDLRGLAIYGNLGDGETCVYAPGNNGKSQARAMLKTDGSVTLMTTDDNTKDGKVVALTVSPTALKFTAPWGSITFDATGFHMKTKAGPRIDMGGIAIPGIPSALSGPLTGYCTITAPVIKLAGGQVFHGAGAVFNPALHCPTNPTLPPPNGVSLASQCLQSQTVYVAP